MNITKVKIERLRAFEIHPFSFSLKLSYHLGSTMSWKDVCLLYIEAVAKMHDLTQGVDLGVVHFVEEVKYSRLHFMWFAVISSDIKEYQALCRQFQLLMEKDTSYLYEYYMHIHRREDEFQRVPPELRAQFDSTLSASAAASVFEKDHHILQPISQPQPGAVVYFWSPASE